ncbi:MAG: VCBS repeat-containing protein [Flavobacteriales bacterium]|nr:VCBS repeat-containing protein [Flavobacteriales bacterium]
MNGDGQTDMLYKDGNGYAIFMRISGLNFNAVSTTPGEFFEYFRDMDSDGDVDLLQLDNTSNSWWLNDGAGHFTSTIPLPDMGDAYMYLDLNNDGLLDLTEQTSTSEPITMIYYEQLPDGQFAASQTISFPAQPTWLVDLNGDGMKDLVNRKSFFIRYLLVCMHEFA